MTGAGDVLPTHENLRRSGRRVRHGQEVQRSAAEELRSGMKYVVVAHGDDSGTIYWSLHEDEEDSRWLWVGMEQTPSRARIYLYCCNAGPQISRYLKDCECFGHCSPVPAPVDEARDVVLDYFGEVDRLMNEEGFSVGEWRERLSTFVGERLDAELEAPTSLLGPSFYLALSRSLHARPDCFV